MREVVRGDKHNLRKSANGAFVNTSWDRSTRHRAHPKRNGLRGFWRENFCRTWWEDLCHFTHQFVSCSFLFRAMENPPTSAAELDSDPDSPQLDQFPLDQQRYPLGLYHSLHNHLRHPDDRRPERKGDVSILLLASHRSKATASCRRLSSGGFRGVADFVTGKMDGMHVLSRFVVHLRSLSTHSSISFYFAVAFLHSGQPGFQLLLVRLLFFV